MAFYLRGLSTLSLGSRLKPYNFSVLTGTRYVSLKVQPPQPSRCETYEERNLRLKRPLSPHVDIYALRFQTALSLGHRVSGIFANGIVVLLAFGSLILAPEGYYKLVEWVDAIEVPTLLLLAAKAGIALPFAYHFASGIRHLFWDSTGKFLRWPGVQNTGYIVLLLTAIFTGFLILLTDSKRPPPDFTARCPDPYERTLRYDSIDELNGYGAHSKTTAVHENDIKEERLDNTQSPIITQSTVPPKPEIIQSKPENNIDKK